MEALELEKIEQDVIDIVKEICDKHNIDKDVTAEFCPGNYIMSIVLVSVAIPTIEVKTGLNIPVDCYIFYDKKKNEQLSIKNAVQKLLKVAKNEQ